MKLKQVLAVMLSSVMVLSAAPTEVFAFDDPGFLTDSSGGTADGEAGQLEAGNASAASAEADGNFDAGEDVAVEAIDVADAADEGVEVVDAADAADDAETSEGE